MPGEGGRGEPTVLVGAKERQAPARDQPVEFRVHNFFASFFPQHGAPPVLTQGVPNKFCDAFVVFFRSRRLHLRPR